MGSGTIRGHGQVSALIIIRGELLLEQNLWCDKVRLTQGYLPSAPHHRSSQAVYDLLCPKHKRRHTRQYGVNKVDNGGEHYWLVAYVQSMYMRSIWTGSTSAVVSWLCIGALTDECGVRDLTRYFGECRTHRLNLRRAKGRTTIWTRYWEHVNGQGPGFGWGIAGVRWYASFPWNGWMWGST